MFELPSSPTEPEHIRPSIYLEYGIDAAAAEDTACEVCERGMRFHSRWQFEVGTLLSVAFTFDGENGRMERVEAEGIVVECGPCAPDNTGAFSLPMNPATAAPVGRWHLTTLAFLEPPAGLRPRLGKVSARLKARPVSS